MLEDHDDPTPGADAARRSAAPDADAAQLRLRAVERALPSVVGTILGGLVLAALAGITGVLSLGIGAVVVGLVVAAAAVAALLRSGEREVRREDDEASALDARELRRERHDAAVRGQLVAAVDRALAHVERLDAECTSLQRRLATTERKLAAKERKLAAAEAFDAERRTLEPAPHEPPHAEQLTLEAVLAGEH